jgi:competence protein ComEC
MDAIQRRLAYIDKQLSYQHLFFEKPAFERPLVFCAIGLITGIVLQQVFGLSIAFWLILLSVSVCAAVALSFLRKKSASYSTAALTALVVLCFVCLGGIRIISFKQLKANDISRLIDAERTLATIRGRILTRPFVNKNKNWQFGRFNHSDPTTSFYLKPTEIETTTGWAKAGGILRVQVNEPVLDLEVGDFIQAYCWLERFKAATNPGQFNIAKYLERRNILVAADIVSRNGIELLKGKSPDLPSQLKSSFQHWAAKALSDGLEVRDGNYGLLEALLLGYRADIDEKTYLAFYKTGLLHFISLSGLHFGILLWVIWSLCKIAGLRKRLRSLVCIFLTVVFLLIVPPRSPTLRAAVIALFFCLSILLEKRADFLNTLSLSAVVLLLYRPTQLFEAGWQLSFATVLGIILFAERIEDLIDYKTNWLFWPDALETNRLRRVAKVIVHKIIQLFCVGISAWLGGAGILLYHFYNITPLSSLWTVLVFPLVALILTAGFLKIILYFVFPTLVSVLSLFLISFIDILIWLVKLISSFDVSMVLIGKVSVELIVFYYLLLAFYRFAYLKSPLLKKVIVTAWMFFLVFWLGAVKWRRIYRDDLILSCLDVGHGQAIVVELPGSRNILFDAGSMYRKDIGRHIVLPFLNYKGIDKLDCVIISHNDIDHINGIPEIVSNCRTGSIFANDAFFDKADRWGTAKFLMDFLYKKGQEAKTLEPTLNISKDTKVKFIWPNKELLQSVELSDNDSSLVTLIEFAGRKILLCSDIEQFAQKELLKLYPNLQADIVVLPHHGSVNTLEAGFINTLNPKITIASCGLNQLEKQNQILPQKAAKLYTYRDGAITISIDSTGRISVSD